MTAPIISREELTERLRQVLGAFYKTVDVMKSARNQPNHIMHVWADDMKAVEDVMFFLEQLRDTGGVAQRPVTPVTDAMVEAGARVMAARRGIKNSDELITTTNSGKVPAWQFYIEEPRAILEAALSTLPSTGLPAPAPHAELVPSRYVVDPTDPTFVKDQAHRDRIEKSPAPHAEVHGVYQLTPQEDATIFGSRATHPLPRRKETRHERHR